VDEDRRSLAFYIDAESKITERFLLGAAIRFEDYSDTGRNETGKITGRFNVTDAFAFRGSVSTGVRAPGIQQAFFSQVSTTLGSGGVLTDTVTVRQGSPLAAAFGILPLKEETSQNATLGFVYRPDNGFSITADLYRIDIEDRIVLSGYVTPDGPAGCVDPLVCPARVLLASVNVGAANFFTNAIDTSTKGIDIVAQYKWELSNGAELLFDAGYSHNETKVDAIKSSSTLLAPNILFDNSQVNLIENGLPKDRGSLGVTYSQNVWRIGLNNSYFGPVRGNGFGPVYTSSGKWLTDVTLNYAFNKNVNVTLGGNNVFDVYPDKWENAFPFPELGFTYGWETLPFSLNGASYYLKLDWKFGSAAK
jgi:iron complex outermembrane recepter protein